MKSLKQLKIEARQAAQRRGHMLSQFVTSGGRTFAVCRRCQKSVEVNGKPAANEIDIGGEAVASNCD